MHYDEKKVMLELSDENMDVYFSGTNERAFTIAFPTHTEAPKQFQEELAARLIECFNIFLEEESPTQWKQDTVLGFRNMERAFNKLKAKQDTLLKELNNQKL